MHSDCPFSGKPLPSIHRWILAGGRASRHLAPQRAACDPPYASAERLPGRRSARARFSPKMVPSSRKTPALPLLYLAFRFSFGRRFFWHFRLPGRRFFGAAFSGKTLLFTDSGAIVYPVDGLQRGNWGCRLPGRRHWSSKSAGETRGNNGIAGCAKGPPPAGTTIGGCHYGMDAHPGDPYRPSSFVIW